MKNLAIILFTLIAFAAKGGDPKSPFRAISEELKSRMHAAIQEICFEKNPLAIF